MEGGRRNRQNSQAGLRKNKKLEKGRKEREKAETSKGNSVLYFPHVRSSFAVMINSMLGRHGGLIPSVAIEI